MKNKLTEKTFRLLDAVADAPKPLSLRELVTQCGVNCATASRILADLAEAGLVEKAGYRRFAPAPGLCRYAEAAQQRNPLCHEAAELLKSKEKELGVSSFLGSWQNGRFFYLHLAGNAPVQAASPQYSGLAAAIWSRCFSEREEAGAALDKLLPDASATERELWLASWENAQKDGYSALRSGSGFWSICFPFRYGEEFYGAAFCGENARSAALDKMQFEISLLVSRLQSRLEKLKERSR